MCWWKWFCVPACFCVCHISILPTLHLDINCHLPNPHPAHPPHRCPLPPLWLCLCKISTPINTADRCWPLVMILTRQRIYHPSPSFPSNPNFSGLHHSSRPLCDEDRCRRLDGWIIMERWLSLWDSVSCDLCRLSDQRESRIIISLYPFVYLSQPCREKNISII